MHKELPLVTVIIVSFNHERFIRINLDSIKNQTYTNIEYVVADDASVDKSIKVFDAWFEKNQIDVKKNYHFKNTGLATTLNECLDLAKGKYIKIIAADDFLHKNYISSCVEYLQSTGLLAVFTQADLVDENSYVLYNECFPHATYHTILQMKNRLMMGNFVPGSTLFLDRQVYDRIGKYIDATLLEDYNLALRMAKNSLFIGQINQSYVFYRSHQNNISKQKLDLLQLMTIKEKVNFDTDGDYLKIINRDILLEIVAGNVLISELKTLHRQLKKKKFTTTLALANPKAYRLLTRIWAYLKRKVKINLSSNN